MFRKPVSAGACIISSEELERGCYTEQQDCGKRPRLIPEKQVVLVFAGKLRIRIAGAKCEVAANHTAITAKGMK